MLVAMKRMTLAALRHEEMPLLHALQRLGAVEIISVNEVSEDNERLTELENRAGQLTGSIKFLANHKKKKGGLLSLRPQVPLGDLIKTREQDVLEKVKDCEAAFAANRAEKDALEDDMEQLAPWRELDIPVEKLAPTKRAVLMAGYVPLKQEALFMATPLIAEGRVEARRYGELSGSRAIFICCLDADLDAFYESIKALSWTDASFSKMKGTPKQILEAGQVRLKELEVQAETLKQSIRDLLACEQKLKDDYDATIIERDKLEAGQRYVHTQRAFVLEGWVRHDDADKVAGAVAEVTDAYSLEFRDPAEGETPPSVVKNNGFVSPFEMVTNLYSRPAPGVDRDPSPWMAPFFFVFFGMMVSDAGYGVIMAILATLFSLKMRPRGMMKQLGWLLAFGGISTLVWGALFGGWLAIEADFIKPLWFSPMEEPLMMLGVCYSLGLIHIFTGMGLKMAADFKNGDWVAAICDTGFWYVLIIGLLMLAAPMLGLPETVGQIGTYMAIGGAVGLLLTQGRHKKNIFSKFTSGLLSLYNITSILGDVLSYSRLFALGLATGVIGMVINVIGSMLGTNVVGYFFMIVVFIGGHIFNLAINTLGAYVHSSRLQYIEFFGKFYESGGREFRPLCVRTKYNDVTAS